MFRMAGVAKLAPAILSLAICSSSPVLVQAGSAHAATGAITLVALPTQGQETYARIHKGGPFPYQKDGSVFGNRERILPAERRGYYLEYTVRTPGVSHRGARRIVCGGQAMTPNACYYTADHYASFRKIVE